MGVDNDFSSGMEPVKLFGGPLNEFGDVERLANAEEAEPVPESRACEVE